MIIKSLDQKDILQELRGLQAELHDCYQVTKIEVFDYELDRLDGMAMMLVAIGENINKLILFRNN